MRHFFATAAFLALSAFALPDARAGDAPPPNAKLEEMRKKLEEARKLLLKKKQEMEGKAGASSTATGTGGKTSGGSGGTGGKPKAEAKGGGGTTATTTTTSKAAQTLADLDRTRDERRKATVTRLRERWGSLVDSEAARQELKTHAERVARLARIRSLAEDKKKLSMIESVDGLVTKEELRHGTAMNALRASGGKP
jgi:hypothetical protein